MLDLFKKYRTLLLLCAFVLSALLFYSTHLRTQERTTLFEKMVLVFTGPLQKGMDGLVTSVADTWSRYLWLVRTEVENRELLQENRRLKAALDQLEEVRLSNERLRTLLNFREDIQLPALPARVIGEDASGWFRTVVIDRGSADGVTEGLAVVVPEGAVGRIIAVAPGYARVLLVTDPSSAVASLVQRSRTRGVARGRGDSLSFEYALRDQDVVIGDRIISSGMGGIFPKGIVLGTVTQVAREGYRMFQEVEIAPFVDFDQLEEVLVLLKEDA